MMRGDLLRRVQNLENAMRRVAAFARTLNEERKYSGQEGDRIDGLLTDFVNDVERTLRDSEGR